MNSIVVNEDLESFAEYIGLTGVDADMFYEVYYEIDPDIWEYENEMTEGTWRVPFLLLYLWCQQQPGWNLQYY